MTDEAEAVAAQEAEIAQLEEGWQCEARADGPTPKWKFRATCVTCGELIEEGRETPRGLIPTGHIVNGGLQCDPCFQKHEAHKAE